MADKLDPVRRSENMRRIKSKNMKPEMLVRSIVHRLGFRFRLHRRDLPGNPDLVFGPRRKIVFVHGCFWHAHHDPKCPESRLPRSNQEYWLSKLQRNVDRDRRNVRKLRRQGWKVMIVWECKTRDTEALSERLDAFLRAKETK